MDMNSQNNVNISIGRMIVTLLMVAFVVVGGTFAWLTYSSKESALVLTIGDINKTQITLSPYEIRDTMTPGQTYTSGVYSDVEVADTGTQATSVTLFYKINDLDTTLIDKGLAYTIIDTSDNSVVKTGYFADLIDTSKTLPESVVILDEKTNSGTTSYYRVYLWIDSNKGSQNDIS